MQILSDLPTDRAMRELSNGRIGPAVNKVVQVMALTKGELVKAIKLMKIEIEARKISGNVDKVLVDWMEKHPDYIIEL